MASGSAWSRTPAGPAKVRRRYRNPQQHRAAVHHEHEATARGSGLTEATANRRPNSGWVGSVTSISPGRRLPGSGKGHQEALSFDNIEHHPLLDRLPIFTTTIRRWLKAGTVELGTYKDTETGTPQGGIVTPRTQKITRIRGFRAIKGL